MTKPNLVFILADDLGWGDLGAFGNPEARTPHLDALAQSGVSLTQHYSASAVCAPARAGLLTGRYPHRTGAIDTLEGRGLDRLSPDETTLADVLKASGYATGLMGKWHLGALEAAYHPNRRGFDEFAGFPNTRDAGLVILDQPIALPEYGALAKPGSLDKLATRRGQQEVTFMISGYGLSKTNPVFVESYRERLMAKTKLVNLRSALTGGFNLQLSANPGGGRGGTCFGDSGGPVFYGGFQSNTIVGVTSFGLNQNCRGVDFAYRTDTAAVFEWIRETVGEEEFAKIETVKI